MDSLGARWTQDVLEVVETDLPEYKLIETYTSPSKRAFYVRHRCARQLVIVGVMEVDLTPAHAGLRVEPLLKPAPLEQRLALQAFNGSLAGVLQSHHLSGS